MIAIRKVLRGVERQLLAGKSPIARSAAVVHLEFPDFTVLILHVPANL